MSLLVVEGLTKFYGETAAVDDLSFELERGEFFTLLGPSGCGKTTTLMTIAGFERPDDGRILLEGVDITRRPPEERGMGVVFQSYALFPHMSAIENVMFPLQMRRVPRAEMVQRAERALAQVELQGRESELPARLSGGQRQRVALARALVFDPAMLLMDEPLAALDRRLRQTMQFELRSLQASLETTVIYVTHDQEEALVLSDRIGVMRAGKFEQLGSPRELYEQPKNRFVASFLGESNRLAVRVADPGPGGGVVVPLASPAERLAAPGGAAGLETGVLVLRPENVRLSSNGTGDAPSLAGEVVDVAFVGDHLLVEVEVAGGERWKARLHPTALASAQLRLERGAAVTVSWDRDAARLMAE